MQLKSLKDTQKLSEIISKKISGGVWLRDKFGSNEMIIDGIIPNRKRNKTIS